ncbi:MAG: hypothetical protein WC719_03785 [Patescibacteria group bacterium]|jgi:hypothetical protein
MQTNRKTIGLLFVLLGLLVIVAIIYFVFMKKAAVEEPLLPADTPTSQLPAGEEKGTTTPSDQPRNYTQYDVTKEATHTVNATDLAQRSKSYAERLGSYSTQSDYGNFTDLKIYMTASLQAWADKYVAEQKASAKSDSYYGITAKALTTEVKSFDDKAGTAEIIVTTERRESTEKIGGGEPFTQKLDLSFLKVNGEWLMDKAYWEK